MIFVYRVENSKGDGPYRPNNSELGYMYKKHGKGGHPLPFRDFERPPIAVEKFGFDSIGKLKAWFKGFYRSLSREGFFIAKYSVPFALAGTSGKQLIFDSSSATLCGTCSILKRKDF